MPSFNRLSRIIAGRQLAELRSIAKGFVNRSARRLGLQSLCRWRNRTGLLVLCYHSVVRESHPDDQFRYRNAVSAGEFERQVRLLSREFQPISATELLSLINNSRPLPQRSVLVTFDDGFRNNLEVAVPILRKHHVAAVFHVATSYIGTRHMLWPQRLAELVLRWDAPHIPLPDGGEALVPRDTRSREGLANMLRSFCKQLPNTAREAYLKTLGDLPKLEAKYHELYEFMTWDEVRALHQAGFEIGSHTASHPILTRLDPGALQTELETSKRVIEENVGSRCRVIAYPNGSAADHSDVVHACAQDAGYEMGFSLESRPVVNRLPFQPFHVNRVNVIGQATHDIFLSRISGLHTLIAR